MSKPPFPDDHRNLSYAHSSSNSIGDTSSQNTHEFDSNSLEPDKQFKKENRLKEQHNQRNFICGCGKSYLSYAALYTHTKTKHDGVFPEGTTTLNKKKPSRSKKEEVNYSKYHLELKRITDFNKELENYLNLMAGAYNSPPDYSRTLPECFPIDIFQKDSLYNKLLDIIGILTKEMKAGYGENYMCQMDLILMEINNAQNLKCNHVFALFLITILPSVSNQFFRECVFFVVSLRYFLNQNGWKKYKELLEGLTLPEEKEFCEDQPAEIVPEICNTYLHSCYTDYMVFGTILKDVEELKFLGVDPIRVIRLVLLIKLFCNWMNLHQFSKGCLEIKKD